VWAGLSPSAIAHSSLWQSCISLELHTGGQCGNGLEENEVSDFNTTIHKNAQSITHPFMGGKLFPFSH
jgi:hypothetical protein